MTAALKVPRPGSLLLTADEVAYLLRICRSEVFNLRRERWLPAPLELGGRLVRWDRRRLEAWIADGAPYVPDWTYRPSFVGKLEELIRARTEEIERLNGEMREMNKLLGEGSKYVELRQS